MLLEEKKGSKNTRKMRNRIELAKRYPIFADYNVLLSQPAFWLESLVNYDDAEVAYQENHKPKT